jgi:hypothetical protein
MSNLFNKYEIKKGDGSPVDPEAQYFVLRIDTDPAARFAIVAYASFIKRSDPQFSRELLVWVREYDSAPNTGLQSDGCPECGAKFYHAPSCSHFAKNKRVIRRR